MRGTSARAADKRCSTFRDNNPSFLHDGVYGFNFFRGGHAYASFPSGHTAVTCAVIAVLWIYYPKWRWLYVLAVLALAIGLIGARLLKGLTVSVGFILWGITLVAFALSGNLLLDFAILFGQGVANMVYVIPSQVLFQERTPADMIGRVVGFRFALVFGGMTLAMAIGGLLALVVGTAAVLVVGGVVTILAGVGGLFVKEMREA